MKLWQRRPGRFLALIGTLLVLTASPAFAQTAATVPAESSEMSSSEPVAASMGAGAARYMTSIDWGVIAIYMVGMLAVGWYYHSRMKDTEDYLLGGRSMKAGSVGLSLFSTLFSTITYLALPGEMIAKGPVILCSLLGVPIVYLVVAYLLIPHFMKLRMTSAYEILETRLGVQVRLLGSSMFLATRMLWMALIIYVTAKGLIVVMMNLDPSWTPWVAAVIGIITVAYTSMGGLRAVVLTDVIQTFILFGGAVLAIGMVTWQMGGVGAWWPRHWAPSWDPQVFFSINPTQRVTVVGSVIYMLVWWVCTAGSDQMAIQRYFATRDVKAARRVLLITLCSHLFVNLLLACLGFALLGFFSQRPDALKEMVSESLKGDKLTTAIAQIDSGNPALAMKHQEAADVVFPHYIIKFIPPGVTGLVIAGLLAAAMSSLASGVNSSCSVISSDFVNRFRRRPPPPGSQAEMRQTRLISWIAGLFSVLLSMLMGVITNNKNIMDATVRTNHVFVAPLFGLFLMAMFVPFATPLATAIGALVGCAVAVVFAYWDFLTGGPTLSFQWISLIALIVDLAVAIPLSYLQTGGRHTGSLASKSAEKERNLTKVAD